LQNQTSFRRFLYKNSYLLVIAAWFITLSFIVDLYWSGNSSVKGVQYKIENYVQQQERAFDKLLKDTSVINRIADNRYDENLVQELRDKKYFFYRYFVNDIGLYHLIFWNTQSVMPSPAVMESPDSTGFIKLPNGFYVWRKSNTANSITVALIPVKWNYIITNEYLENTFVAGQGIENSYDISAKPTTASVRSVNGNELFYLIKKYSNSIPTNNLIAVWLRIIGVIFLFLLIHLIASFIARTKGWAVGTVFLLGTILLLRIASYYLPIPLNFRQFELFDPAIYGSNIVFRSLGDLLINSVLFTWIVLFVRHQLHEEAVVLESRKPAFKWLLLAGVTLLLIAATFTCAQVIRSMVADSQISFDVINFFTLNFYSVTGFVVLCCIAIGYFMLSQALLYIVKPLFSKNLIVLYLAVAVGGLIYLTYKLIQSDASFELVILAWLLFYLWLMNSNYLTLLATRISSSRLVFWLFFFSLSITAVIVLENDKKELRLRERAAETLATKADPSSETLMNTMLTDFRNEFLAENFNRLKSDSSSRIFKDSLVNSNFSGYTNKYDTKLYTFDANEKPLFNPDSSDFNDLNAVLNTQAKPTGIPDLYYYDQSYDRFSYICRKNIKDIYDSLVGYMFILANPRQNKPETLDPELFSRGHNNAIENSSIYASAVYSNLQLVNSHNDYPFASKISPQQVPKEEFTSYQKKDYNELWYKAGHQKVVVIAKEENFVIESITLFSYLFCAFLLVTAMFWLVNILIRARLTKQHLRDYWQLSIRNQIHGTIIFISVLSFLVIGIATILFFISRYQANNREKLSVAIHVMESEVRTALSDISVFDDVVKVYDVGYREKLEKIIARISEIHAFDINLYDLDGNLQVSSLPLPYKKGIVSDKMDPLAYYHLNTEKEVQYFSEEKIGKLNYVSNYVPVIDETGREQAYLNIPHFTSQSKLRQEISYFLVTIINLNAFIFLIAGIVALFITNRITRSFSFISDKMKAVNIGQLNEAIDWKRNDEIGELVKEYNKMVSKLDDSAAALAKSEREGAWREMARQVAHEIKNPLTPMKLSLQYLQKAIIAKSDNVVALTASVSETLVQQIDHLNRIAGDFGQFANIGHPHNSIFALHDVMRSVTLLYAHEDKMKLTWQPVEKEIMINADSTHINRLFTNLIQNALQAIPPERAARIEIDETLNEDTILVRVKDNGLGIPEIMRSKIFTPNFTTKTSGTGLGLAMCKGIVEEANGQIWFETEMGDGTTFFVELPVV